MNLRIYLAGPDVFDPKAHSIFSAKKSYINSFNKPVDTLTPFDLCPPDNLDKKSTAALIRKNNLELIKQADYIVANLNPFRGHEPDSGTVYEVAFAHALGKKTFAYMYDFNNTQIQRIGKQDSLGNIVEDFDLPLNLMLHCENLKLAKTFEEAVKLLMDI